jgi:hypothetical protein
VSLTELAGGPRMNRLFRLRPFALIALLLAACAGAVVGGEASCTGSVALITQVSGECRHTIDALDETAPQRIAIQTTDVSPFATVTFTVTVEEGAVQVRFTNSRGEGETFEATPGSPATGNVRVQLDLFNRINFDLEPVGGPASGVAYQLSFVCDCLP